MPKKLLRLPALLAFAIAAVGAAAAVFAESAPTPQHASALGDALRVASSSTTMQSFLWIIDDKKQTITFCFTTASPEAGAQYDFGCRQRPAQEAIMH